ncbi:unnamed protein product, partial [Linum tenue]
DPRIEIQRGLERGDNPKGWLFYYTFLLLSRNWICASAPSAASLPAGRIFHIPVLEINESPCLSTAPRKQQQHTRLRFSKGYCVDFSHAITVAALC